MRGLIKAAMFVAMIAGGGDAGQGLVSRFFGLMKGDAFAITRSLTGGHAAPIAYSAGKPVRFGW